jgi:hypothetical protein
MIYYISLQTKLEHTTECVKILQNTISDCGSGFMCKNLKKYFYEVYFFGQGDCFESFF